MKPIEELNSGLQKGEIINLTAEEWNSLAVHFEELERHHTFVVGELLILQGETGLIAVDQPTDDQRIIRHLASPEEKDRFVQDRLAAYERMWDGCGCRIDYTK